jgi:hypothetical protein
LSPVKEPLPPLLSVMVARMRSARSQASSSVAARIGRNETLMPSGARPAAAAEVCTAAICSAVSFSGSPQRAKTSATAPPVRYAAGDEPPKYSGIRCAGWAGREKSSKR